MNLGNTTVAGAFACRRAGRASIMESDRPLPLSPATGIPGSAAPAPERELSQLAAPRQADCLRATKPFSSFIVHLSSFALRPPAARQS